MALVTQALVRRVVLAMLPVWALPVAAAAAAEAPPPRVVVSIQPIHSLVAGVMQGVGSPGLLVNRGASPHAYQMRPSEAKALGAADLVVWVGEGFEAFLAKTVAGLGAGAKIVELMDAPGVELLPSREGGGWEAHAREDGDGHRDHLAAVAGREHDHGSGGTDAHIWLSPANARAIVRAVAEGLAEVDPDRKDRYAANAQALAARLDALEAEIAGQLAPVRGRPFVVLHDAYQYFERAFGLSAAGSITVSPERQPGAGRLAGLRERIRRDGAACVFGEPQVHTRLVATVAEGTGAGVGELDAEGGTRLEPGPDAYFTLMRRNAKSLADCLSRPS